MGKKRTLEEADDEETITSSSQSSVNRDVESITEGSSVLFLGNCPQDLTEQEIRNYYKCLGAESLTKVDIRIETKNDEFSSKNGICYLVFKSPVFALKAFRMEPLSFEKTILNVELVKGCRFEATDLFVSRLPASTTNSVFHNHYGKRLGVQALCRIRWMPNRRNCILGFRSETIAREAIQLIPPKVDGRSVSVELSGTHEKTDYKTAIFLADCPLEINDKDIRHFYKKRDIKVARLEWMVNAMGIFAGRGYVFFASPEEFKKARGLDEPVVIRGSPINTEGSIGVKDDRRKRLFIGKCPRKADKEIKSHYHKLIGDNCIESIDWSKKATQFNCCCHVVFTTPELAFKASKLPAPIVDDMLTNVEKITWAPTTTSSSSKF